MKFTTLSLLVCSLCACSTVFKKEDSIPGYKITVIQGNELTQNQFSQLHIGMTKEDVKQLLGNPQLKNPFRDDSWHYIYTVLKADKFFKKSDLVLQFSGDVLTNISGNPEEFNYLDI
ncbi:MAG: outer membrane protein assembly factor BamE [Neisseriaceae bacterium]|nr:MAG: outer membrane protein assembly factor BamE [Neisseriaceae bacterium]